MSDTNETKRLFFGFDVYAPWPAELPSGRVLDPSDRHMTIAFLGSVSYSKIADLLPNFPKPPFNVGLTGFFDKCLCLPEHHPHVIAWRMGCWSEYSIVEEYQMRCIKWLREKEFFLSHADSFLPHVTLCRSPFVVNHWKKSFASIPFYIKDLHLYESLGNSKYQPIWTVPLQAPFEELDHTADMAFLIRGGSINQIYHHAYAALSFHYPLLNSYTAIEVKLEKIEDVVTALNTQVSRVDQEIGCPFKAVTFHGDLLQDEHGFKWEMIVDV